MLSARAIDSELISQQYDQMVKYATALRLAPPKPSRCCANSPVAAAPSTRTYQGLEELGRVIRTIINCEYASNYELRREIHEGLQTAATRTSITARAETSSAPIANMPRFPCSRCTCCRPR